VEVAEGMRRPLNKTARLSKPLLEREKKSEYWVSIMEEINSGGELNQDELNNFISRSIALGVVPNFKDRESRPGVLGTISTESVLILFVIHVNF
jgi:hypothetical protein